MKVDVLLGLQWGDEGKGKVVDVLTPRYDVVARFQGGPNAGHTLEFEGQTAIEQGMDTSFYFHSDGTVDVVLNGGASQEGSFVMSGNWAEVTLDGVTESMEYDGSTDVLTLEDNGVYLVLEYNGM